MNRYQNWDEASFKKRLRVSQDKFEFILGEIKDLIKKEPTRMKPHPTPNATQLALCFHRLEATLCTLQKKLLGKVALPCGVLVIGVPLSSIAK